MKLATWNVNSLRVRLPQVLDWLKQHPVDMLCLQELKLNQDKFPLEAFEEIGYTAQWAGQPTYNGVAIISKIEGIDIQRNIPEYEDHQQRIIAATYDSKIGPLRVISAYCPNGQDLESDKYQYKLDWFEALHDWLQKQLSTYPHLVILGDYNVAPQDLDVHDPKKWEGKVHVSPAERAAWNRLIDLGLHDAFRMFDTENPGFSWWDYRRGAFRRDAGLRIDHALISTALKPYCTSCWVDKAPRSNEQPSDHTPVIVEFNF